MDDAQPTRVASVVAERQSQGKSVKVFVRDVLVILLAAILISFLVKTFLVRSFYIPSESMMDTLHRDDRVIVNQLTPDLTPVQRGDVVVFKDPGGWLDPRPPEPQNPVIAAFDWFFSFVGLSAPDSNDHLIKRAIGLPGDVVACCNEFGELTINGNPVDEPYVVVRSGTGRVSETDFAVTVPQDSLWVLGDNRYASADSRFHTDKPGGGFVPYENVVGRAILITWPIDRWSWLDNHEFTFR
ncbi:MULTISPECIES: signal peptidase I [unclassified Salinibacterium]|uniref:signal peptidase I n=1 Tax=unclassified Salinibacterium TaxID=2632331 RepID=UPI00141E0A03|nr:MULTISPECIES: signal peptidase I [unclassified Salinibacterium]